MELKKWTMDEKAALVELCNRVDRSFTSNRMPLPYTEADADAWLKMVWEREGKSGIWRAIMIDGECKGSIFVEQKDDVSEKDSEIGYMILTEYWGKGIMTEAVRQMVEITFDQLDILRITALVHSPNIASCRVLEKNGFELEGTMRKAVFKYGEVCDLLVFGKCK